MRMSIVLFAPPHISCPSTRAAPTRATYIPWRALDVSPCRAAFVSASVLAVGVNHAPVQCVGRLYPRHGIEMRASQQEEARAPRRNPACLRRARAIAAELFSRAPAPGIGYRRYVAGAAPRAPATPPCSRRRRRRRPWRGASRPRRPRLYRRRRSGEEKSERPAEAKLSMYPYKRAHLLARPIVEIRSKQP